VERPGFNLAHARIESFCLQVALVRGHCKEAVRKKFTRIAGAAHVLRLYIVATTTLREMSIRLLIALLLMARLGTARYMMYLTGSGTLKTL